MFQDVSTGSEDRQQEAEQDVGTEECAEGLRRGEEEDDFSQEEGDRECIWQRGQQPLLQGQSTSLKALTKND